MQKTPMPLNYRHPAAPKPELVGGQRSWIALVLMLSAAFMLPATGGHHWVAIIGLMMFADAPLYHSFQLPAWGGFAALACACFLNTARTRPVTGLCGLALLVISWLIFLSYGDQGSMRQGWLFSVPFAVIALFFLRRCIKDLLEKQPESNNP